MRLISIISLALAGLFLASFDGAHGCGMIMHMEASNRAVEFFSRTYRGIDIRELLQRKSDAFLTGSVYPDAYYSPLCLNGEFATTSKMSHGMDFIIPALDYFSRTYLPRPNSVLSEKGETFLAFLLGVVAHTVQDRAWHGYGIDQGFLSTVAQVNFHGNFSAAHPVADFGGDSVLLYELNFVNLHLAWSQWVVPLDDLYTIYKNTLCGVRPCDAVTGMRKAIAYCTRLTMGRAMLNKMLSHRWYVSYGMKAPMLVSPRFTDYFLGGMNDMSSWTMQRLETAIRYLENSRDCKRTSTDDNPLYWVCGDQPAISPPPSSWFPPTDERSTSAAEEFEDSKKNYVSKMFEMTNELAGTYGSDDDLVEVFENKDTGEIVLRPKGALRTAMNDATMNELLEFGDSQRADTTQQDQFASPAKDHYKYHVNKAYSLIGQAMVSADINRDGYDDLIVGVPGYSSDNRFDEGRVFVLMGSENGLDAKDVDLETAANSQTIAAPFTGTGRFGYAITVLDFNHDSLPDLAISAPIRANDVVNKPYSGFVYLYYGQADGKFKAAPDVTIDCNMRYCNFGTMLSTGDVNRDGRPDLIVGSPFATRSFEKNRQTGLVTVFYSSSRDVVSYNSYRQADVKVWGLGQYSWFGHSAITTPQCDLLIGAPGEKTSSSFDHRCSPDLQMSGTVYCYSVGSSSISTFAHGTKEFEFFGASLALGYPHGRMSAPVLAIAAPNSDNIGKLVGFLPYLLRQSGTVYLYNPTTKAEIGQFVGDRLYGAFGRVMKFEDVDRDGFDDLIVGAPVRSNDVTNVLYGFGIGELYLYYGRPSFPQSALARSCESRFKPCPADQADSIFASGLPRRAQLGSNAVLVKAANITQLVVASQRTDDYGRQSGKLLLFNNCLSLA